MATTKNRETWLTQATREITRLVFKPEGLEVPEVRVSVGFPSRGALSARSRTIGQCWYGTHTGDKVPQIFISPVIDDDAKVLATLTHELLHATLPSGSGHGPKFAKAMKPIGLEGKPTATEAGKNLLENLEKVSAKVGDFPHARIDPKTLGKKQSTRLLKAECPECGYVVRVTKKWLLRGFPVCPEGDEMEPDV